jgi:O-antigen ligase
MLGQQDQARFDLWTGAIRLILDHPWGVGIGNYLAAYEPYARGGRVQVPHNLYLQVAAEMGLVALLVFLGMLGYWLLLLFRTFLGSPRGLKRCVLATCLAALLAMVVEGLGLNLLTLRHMWVLVGFALAVTTLPHQFPCASPLYRNSSRCG